MRSPAMKRDTPPSLAQCLVSLGKPRGLTVFIDFQDLASIAIFGVVLSLFFVLLGTVPLIVPLMILVLLIATVLCGNMQ